MTTEDQALLSDADSQVHPVTERLVTGFGRPRHRTDHVLVYAAARVSRDDTSRVPFHCVARLADLGYQPALVDGGEVAPDLDAFHHEWIAGPEAFATLRARFDADYQDFVPTMLERLVAVVEAVQAAGDPAGSSRDVRAERWISTAEAAGRLGMDRGTLDKMVQDARKGLPGAPVHKGKGKTRQHLLWDADRLDEWVRAVEAWRLTRGRRS